MAAAQTKGHEEDKHTGMLEKNAKRMKRKTKSRSKAHKQARNRTQGVSIGKKFPYMLQSRDGDLATPSAIFFLLSLATVSGVTAAAVEPPPPRTIQRNPDKLPGLGDCVLVKYLHVSRMNATSVMLSICVSKCRVLIPCRISERKTDAYELNSTSTSI